MVDERGTAIMSQGHGTWGSSALGALGKKIKALLSEKLGGAVRIEEIEPLVGGVCQDNLKIELEVTGGPNAGWRRYALRSDSPSSLPGSLRRREEFIVVTVANKAGVLTPAAHWLTRDLVREGADAYFLDFIQGYALGRRVVSDPSLAGERVRLGEELAAVLAAIHKLTPDDTLLPIPNLDDTRRLGAPAVGLRLVQQMLSKLPEAHPALRLAVRWLEANAPQERDLVLVHGDFRTGNLVVTRSGLAGVLDWEFAHWGSPYEDLAWLCVRDWRFGELSHPVGGFGERAAFYAAYEQASGRIVDPAVIHWWEVLGNMRWAAGCMYQGQRYTSGLVPDLELIALASRAAEMEWEALRLIEVGPSVTRRAAR